MTVSEATAFPATDQAVDLHVDSGAFLDRASAFIRSWGIRDVSPSMTQVLAAWRIAEHDLDRSTPGSEAWNDASGRFIAARLEYRRLFDVAVVDADSLRRVG